MGCRLSKIDSELVKLCREKKELIMAARDCRNALAFAHIAYFQSMHSLENELKPFLEEALVICFNSSSETGLDHQTVEEVLHTKNSSTGSDNDYNGDGDDHVDDGGDDDNDEENGYFPFTDDVHEGSFSSEPNNVIGQQRPLVDFVFPSYRNEISFGDSAYSAPTSSRSTYSMNYQTSLGPNSFRPSQDQTAMPSSSARSLPNSDAGAVSFGGRTDYTVMKSRFFQHESGAEGVYVMDFPSNFFWHSQTYNYFDYSSSPLRHEVSTWDYINPFNLVEYTFPNFNFAGTYGTSFSSNDVDLTELRESEGIPDLEYELDHPIIEDTSDEEYLDSNNDVSGYNYGEAARKDGNDVYPGQKEDVSSIGNGLVNIGNEKKDRIKTKDLQSGPRSEACYRQEESIQKEMNNSREKQYLCSETVAEFNSNSVADSPKDLREILNEIKEAFDGSSMHEKDVLEMLGSYRPGFASCIESSTASSRKTSAWARGMLKRSAHRISKMANVSSECLEKETSETLCNFSLTLEKLCILENKLYQEVKGAEKLRNNLEKESKKLKKLVDRGVDSSKGKAGQLSVQKLTPRIDVAISTIEGIATRIHNIRDEELQPQLCGLIQRFHKMWKFLFEAHKKQAEAIIKTQAHVTMSCTTTNSSLMATQKLEAGIIELATAFSDWIKGQKELASLLKNWLAKFLPQQNTEIHSTPTVFSICIHWLNAVERVSEFGIVQALDNFKLLLRQLQHNMQEERQQRLKIEHLSSYHEKKLKKFCLESGVEFDQYASLLGSTNSIETGNLSMDALLAGLRPIRMKLDEATVKREQEMKQINDVAAHVLQIGFVPVLEALESFSLQMYNAYEQIVTTILY